MDGFEVLRQVGAERMPATIFVTAYDRYALRAFDTNALDYLLKPVERSRFERALLRAKERIAERWHREVNQRVIAVLDQVKRQEEYLDRLPVSENGRILFVKTREIDLDRGTGQLFPFACGRPYLRNSRNTNHTGPQAQSTRLLANPPIHHCQRPPHQGNPALVSRFSYGAFGEWPGVTDERLQRRGGESARHRVGRCQATGVRLRVPDVRC